MADFVNCASCGTECNADNPPFYANRQYICVDCYEEFLTEIEQEG